jgi:hypothetical protein
LFAWRWRLCNSAWHPTINGRGRGPGIKAEMGLALA